MSSLHPGVLFNNPGLNKRYTALSPLKTEQEHSQRSSSVSCGGQILPKPSPVSRVYDVPNSSSRLILLNNKFTKKSMGSRLRGQTEIKGDINHPQPERHLSDTPRLNKIHHKKCAVSESERFLPSITPSVSPSSDSRNSTKQSAGKGVVKSHDCHRVDYEIIKLFDKLQRPPRLSAGRPHSLPTSFSSFIDDCSLKHGERHYLASIAQIYGVEHMRQQKIQQYNQLMWKEISKGNYSSKEVNKYFKYLSRPHSVGGVAGHVSTCPKQSHASPSRRPKSHGNQKKERAPTEHSRSWTAVKHSPKKWDSKENRSSAKRTESKHADKKTQLENRNPTQKTQHNKITDESRTKTRETIKREDSCSSESRSEQNERKGLKDNNKETKTQDMNLDRTNSSDEDDSDSSLSESDLEDDSTVDHDSDTETETKHETHTESDETNRKESVSDRLKSDSYSEQETETILSKDSETDLNIKSHEKRKKKVGMNKVGHSSSDEEVSSNSESEQEEKSKNDGIEKLKKKNSSTKDDLSFSGSENNYKHEQKFRSGLGIESNTEIEEESKNDLVNESKTELEVDSKSDLEEDSKSDKEKESKTVVEEESKVDLVSDSRTDLVKESKSHLEEESKSDLEKESKTDIEEESKVNIVNDSKTDLVKESKSNLKEESKSEFEETYKTDLLKESKSEHYTEDTSANQDNVNSLQSNEESKMDENRNFDTNKESDITTKEMTLSMETQSHDHDYQVNITAENNDSAKLNRNVDERDSHTQESNSGDIADNSGSETNAADKYSGQNSDNQESINLVHNKTQEVFRTSTDSSVTLDNNKTQEQDAKVTQHDTELSINEVIDAMIETNTDIVNIESQGPTSHNESHENIENKRHDSSSSSSEDGFDNSSSDDSISDSDSSDNKDLETESPSTATQDNE